LGNSQRRSIVRLIRKKDKDPSDIKNWRPISLINCDVKIFSRLLTARLDIAIGDILSHEQLAFVKNRNIFDGIRYIDYIIDHLEKHNETGFIASFDMQKAFDSISHEYIWDLLSSLNFPTTFISYLKTLYNKAESVVMNNGLVTRPIPLGRSCRQGDCISPSLFILAMEPLIRLIKRNPNIKGINALGNNKKISVYADDITGFLTDTNDLMETINTIKYFGTFTGLKLNEEKTEVLRIGQDGTPVPLALKNYRCVDNIKITGIFFSGAANAKNNEKLNFEAAINKSRSNFNRWNSRNISVLGRTILAKSHGLAQIQFLANAIAVPEWAISQMKKIIYKFIWKGVDKITRNLASKPIKEGGINLPILDDVCRAAGIQWLRRMHKTQQPWINFLKCDLKANGGLASLNVKKYDKEIKANNKYTYNIYIARCWRDIRSQTDNLPDAFLGEVLWNNKKFAYKYRSRKNIPLGRVLSRLGYTRVGDFFDSDGRIIEAERALARGIPMAGIIEWTSGIKFIKKYLRNRPLVLLHGYNPPDQNLVQKDTLQHNISLVSNGMEYPLEVLTQKNILRAIAASRPANTKFLSNKLLMHGSNDSPQEYSKKIKSFSNSTKNRSFLFKLFNGLIYSNKELTNFGYTTEDYCSFCKKENDSRDHMMLDCKVVRILRNKIYQRFHLDPCRLQEWFGTGDKIEDFILLSLNKFIYYSKVAGQSPSHDAFYGSIINEYHIEYKIAERNGTLIRHFSKWDKIKEVLNIGEK